MKPTRYTLCEGVRLTHVRTDAFKSALFLVNLSVPLKKETASAYSLLTDVLMQGTQAFPTMQSLNRKQDELYSLGLGSYVQKNGEVLSVTAELSVLEDAFAFDGMPVLEESFALLHQLLFCPLTENGVFKKSYVEREKRNLIDDLRSRINNKSSYAFRRCIEVMCDGEPYAADHGGSEDEAEKLNERILFDTYTDLMQNARVELCYVGRAEETQVEKLCRKYLPFSPSDAVVPKTLPHPKRERAQTVVETMPVTQCNLILGFSLPVYDTPEGYAKFLLFNELFGNSPSSRLFMNVREKESLCYSCASHPARSKGLFFVTAGVEQCNKQKAIDAILAEWNDLKNGNCTEEELSAAKRSLHSAYAEIPDSPSSLYTWYFRRGLAGWSDTPEEAASLLDGVTAEQIREIACSLTLDTVYSLEGEAEQ